MPIPMEYLKASCLVVDDELTMRLTIKNMLSRMGFKNVILAENGKKALELIKLSKFDIVICDVNMSEMTGIELFKTVRENKKFEDLSFIFVTAEARRDVVARVAENAANEYIIKPFVMATLEDKMLKILEKKYNPSDIDKYLEQFKKAMEAKDIASAEKALEAASILAPGSATILYNYGQIELLKGNIQGALALFNEAIDKKPMFVKAYNAIGEIYENLGDIENAIHYYERAHHISPANTERLIALSKLYHKTGNVQKAESLLLETKTDAAEGVTTSKRLLGEIYLAKNENEKALETLLTAYKKNPNDIFVMDSLAQAYRKLNKPDDALDIYREILKISPDNANVYYNMGKTYLEKGDKAQAIECIKKAWELNPFSKEITADLRALAEKDRIAL